MLRKALFSTPPHSPSLAEWVTRNLREAILLGKLEPGERIIENDLAHRMKISRSPIREALRLLEREGLVALTPRKGVRISELSPKEVEEIYAIRANLEGLATSLAVPNLTSVHLKTLKALLKQMSERTKKKDVEAIVKLNEKFHEHVLRMAGNGKLNQLIQSLRDQIKRFRVASLALPGRLQEALIEHERIVEACKMQDAVLAERLMKEHIRRAGNELLKKLKKGRGYGKN